MADKTQNININYKFNTAEIEKAQQALNRANEASNKLQSSAAKGGSAIIQEFGKSNKTILDMQTALTRLKSSIEVTSNPQKLAQLTGEYKTMKKALDDATKSAFGFGKATTESSKGVQSLVLGFRELSRFAGAAVLAGIAKKAVDLTLSLATLQGQVEGVERGFNRAFANPGQILEQVREATHGTITDFELMKRTLQATNLGVSVEHLGKLFEFAAVRAQQTGESVDYLVDSIVRGIGRKSPLVLDNLGISVTALKEKFNGASLASQSVADATKGVAEIAEEQLKKMGGFVDTAETKVKALGVAWENVRISFAKRIDSSGFIQFLKDAADGINSLIKGGEALRNEETKAAAQQRLNAIMRNDVFKDQKQNQLAQLDLLTQELMATRELIRTKESEIKAFEAAKTAQEKQITTDEFGNIVASEAVTFREKAIESLKRQVEEYRALAPMIANALRVMQSEMELEKAHTETLDEMRERLKGLIEEFDNWVTVDNKESTEAKTRIKNIKDLRHEIEAIEALLKDPKELKFRFKEKKDTRKIDTSPLKLKPVDAGAIFDDFVPLAEKKADIVAMTFWERLGEAFKRNPNISEAQDDLNDAMTQLELGAIQILGDQLMSIADIEADSFDRRIRQARQFYETNLILAGDNEQAKDKLRLLEDKRLAELRKRQFIAEQKAMKQKAVINGATAITKTFAEYGFTPAAIVASVLLAAEIASQVAIIDRQQPRFKEGVINLNGPGTATSDSIPAWLSKGESVMTAWETKNSGGILKDIRAKKLDDKVLRDLKIGRATTQVFNDERIIKAIKENRPPDIIEQSGIIYKGTRKSEDYINKVRAKSVRI